MIVVRSRSHEATTLATKGRQKGKVGISINRDRSLVETGTESNPPGHINRPPDLPSISLNVDRPGHVPPR